MKGNVNHNKHADKFTDTTQCPEAGRSPLIHKKPGKGVRMTSQSKHIVERVRQFFEKEKACIQSQGSMYSSELHK